ncbi:MAG: hypothetical protein J0I21_01580, partial [Alphaproteobacteria bacterium]|nr:hypothetical protein [Alphaproteobacteria bacterium]
MSGPAAAPLRHSLHELLAGAPELGASLDLLLHQAERSFPGASRARWLAACRDLTRAGLGSACLIAYLRQAPGCAALLGTE